MTLFATIVAVLFGGHVLLTCLCQLPLPRLSAIMAKDRFALIPRWNFFAPTPGDVDYHCLVRPFYADGAPGAWKELRFAPPARSPAAFLWNPDKRASKALFDAVSTLFQVANGSPSPERTVPLSVPYLALLTAASARVASPLVSAVQFMVMQSSADRSPELLFLSNVHDV